MHLIVNFRVRAFGFSAITLMTITHIGSLSELDGILGKDKDKVSVCSIYSALCFNLSEFGRLGH